MKTNRKKTLNRFLEVWNFEIILSLQIRGHLSLVSNEIK